MNRFIFHTEQLSERGTETSLRFLANALKKLGREVSICYDKENSSSHPKVIKVFEEEFNLIPYSKFDPKSKDISRNFDFAYFMKHSSDDKKYFQGVFNANHIVFPEYLPHGNTYTYISRTLAEYSKKLANKRLRLLRRGPKARIGGCINALHFDYMDYMVDMPIPKKISRIEFGIPEDAFVIMRIGGRDSFDIPWVKSTLLRFLESHKDVYFLAINTPVFSDLPRIKYLDAVVDLAEKASIFGISDLFLHGRSLGESFGMAIVEAMQLGIPTIAWHGGRDTNHRVHLEQFNLLYRDEIELWDLLVTFRQNSETRERLQFTLPTYANRFRPNLLLSKYLESLFLIK